jgi:hypothetical protein
MKTTIIIGLLIAALFLVSCTTEKPIGGDKDEHGCLIAAGYSWCPSTQQCQRMWETYCEEYKDQYRGDEITNFDECVAAGNPVMESYPRQCSANGQTFTEDLTHVCTEEEKGTYACTMEYMPVCGEIVLNMGETVYQTFGNGCSACAGMKVVSYTPGECPPEKTTELCSDGKGNYLTLQEAEDYAKSSECGDNLIIDCTCPDGYRKDGDTCNPECYYSTPQCMSPSMQCEKTYFCNEGTGTMWINLDMEKAGCNPACVIHVETGEAEINWRCTGLLPE